LSFYSVFITAKLYHCKRESNLNSTCWFKKLYHYRWGVEENYKREKQRLEIENFSGKSVAAVLQDFQAKIIALNLTSMFVWIAQIIGDRVYSGRIHYYQINDANALSVLKNDWLICWRRFGEMTVFIRILSEIVNHAEPVRDGRFFPRKNTTKSNRLFFANYKRTQ